MEKKVKIYEGEREINCTLWSKPDDQRVLIIAPAMGVSSRFYRPIAKYFHNQDINLPEVIVDFFMHWRNSPLLITSNR